VKHAGQVSTSVGAAQWEGSQMQLGFDAGIPIIDCDLRFAFQYGRDIGLFRHLELSDWPRKTN